MTNSLLAAISAIYDGIKKQPVCVKIFRKYIGYTPMKSWMALLWKSFKTPTTKNVSAAFRVTWMKIVKNSRIRCSRCATHKQLEKVYYFQHAEDNHLL